MRVLHAAPLWFPVAEDSAGGIETYLPMLIGALEDLGCENSLLASGDSRTPARLIRSTDRNIWDGMESGAVWEYQPYEQHQVMSVVELADQFDVVHSHLGFGGLVLSSIGGLAEKVLHTQHNAVTQDLGWFVERHPDLLFSTVSEFQATKLRAHGARRCHVIPNGIDFDGFPFQAGAEGALVYIGRMEEEKGPDIAVRVARELDLELSLAGPMSDGEFFDREIRPGLSQRIRYVGVVDHKSKTRLLGRASCALMPSRWEEPFGLVAVEAMACGTPVVALASGALPELIEPGVGGYLAENEAELAAKVRGAIELPRTSVREFALSRFDIRAVALRYLELYSKIAGTAPNGVPAAGSTVP